jgi:hypothetical protein
MKILFYFLLTDARPGEEMFDETSVARWVRWALLTRVSPGFSNGRTTYLLGAQQARQFTGTLTAASKLGEARASSII